MNSTKTLNYKRFYICAAILSVIDSSSLIDLLKPLINTFLQNRNILPIIFQHLSLLDIDNISSYLKIIDKDDKAYLDFCYAVSFNLNRDDYWLQFTDGESSNFLTKLNPRKLKIFFYFVYKYCPSRYTALQNRAKFLIKSELFEYVEYHHLESPSDEKRTDDVRILSRNTIDNLNNLLENRTTAFLLNKVVEYKERDKKSGKVEKKWETRYAAIPITGEFKKGLINSLKEIEFKIIAQTELEFFVNNSIEKPITKLIPAKPEYIKFADLHKDVRSSKLRDETQKDFQSQLETILKKDIFHKYKDVKDISEIIKEFNYEPVPLVNHFQ